MTPRFVLSVLLGSALVATILLSLGASGPPPATAFAAIDPPPESARTDAPAVPAGLPRETTVDDAIAPWRRGEYVVAGLAALALLLGVALRIDPKRAAYYTAGLGAFAACIELVHAGRTPNTSMLVGAAAAFILWLMRSPLPAKPPEPRDTQRGAISTPIVWLLSLTVIVGGGLIWSCASTREAVRQTGRDIVDCTTVTASAHTAAYGKRIEDAIKEHTAEGETDWGKVGEEVAAIMREAGTDVAGCVARATFERLLGVPTLAGPDLREGWERVRLEVLGGRRYLPEVAPR